MTLKCVFLLAYAILWKKSCHEREPGGGWGGRLPRVMQKCDLPNGVKQKLTLPAPLNSQTGSNPIPTLFDYLNRKKIRKNIVDQARSIQNLATPETLGHF